MARERGQDGRFLKKIPESVSIVAMGASNATWLALCANNGHPRAIADETWAINATAPLIHHDRAFVTDDVKHVITAQAQEDPPRKVAQGILEWLPEHPGPVYTTTAYPEWPALVEMPLAEMAESIGGLVYLNNSVAYAVAYAIYLFAKHQQPQSLFLFGCDFVYPDQPFKGEPGRGCVEFLLGIATARGMNVNVPDTSTLLDANMPDDRRLYGFPGPAMLQRVDGKLRLLRGDECTSSDTRSS